MFRLTLLISLVALLVAGCGGEETPRRAADKPDVERYRRTPVIRAAPPAEVFAPVATNDPERILAMGERYYRRVCADCHDRGLAGAPVLGDRAAWGPRLEKGVPRLVRNAIEGFGEMPPRGGDPSLRKEAVGLAVEYMVKQARRSGPVVIGIPD